MNYRHAFHAGNFADVLKHATLAQIVAWLAAKPAPFRIVDTHAGAGLYDLGGDGALRTGEWRDGIGRFDIRPDGPLGTFLQPWLDTVATVRARYGDTCYPGSPLVARAGLRRGDRLILAETEPGERNRLTQLFQRDPVATALATDGYAVWKAQAPPPERRGLILVDPPFEAADEFARLVEGLRQSARRWPAGSVMIWYPVKDVALVDAFWAQIAELPLGETWRVEIAVAGQNERRGLSATGLVLVNPPWRLPAQLNEAGPVLARRLAVSAQTGWRCERIIDERRASRDDNVP